MLLMLKCKTFPNCSALEMLHDPNVTLEHLAEAEPSLKKLAEDKNVAMRLKIEGRNVNSSKEFVFE